MLGSFGGCSSMVYWRLWLKLWLLRPLLDSQKLLRSPDIRHELANEVYSIDSLWNAQWIKAELAAMVQCERNLVMNLLSREFHFKNAKGWQGSIRHKYLSAIRLVAWVTPSTITTFERGPSEGVNNDYSGTYVRTISKGRELKDLSHILNHRALREDLNPYISLLHECINTKDLAKGKQVHAHIIQRGLEPNMCLLNTLIDMYAKCGSLVYARQVFDRMLKRDMFTWTVMMAGYNKYGNAEEGFKFFEQMQHEGVMPDKVTFICILSACACLGDLEKGKKVHADIRRAGIVSYINLENTLIDMYAKCGSMKDAHQVFNGMAIRDVVSWNAMIAGYAKHGCGGEAFKMYEQMQQEGPTPDRVTFICILNACATLGALEKGKEVHADIIKAGIASYVNLENTLVDMYSKCGCIKDARQVFDNMAKRNVVSWSAMITGYAQHGLGTEAFKMYEQMQWEGLIPNRVTFICILNACASLGTVQQGKKVHADIIKAVMGPEITLETALVDMYAKCGCMKDAHQMFDYMGKRNVVSWSVMIAGYAQHGCGMEAFTLYEQMQHKGLIPDKVTFICILNACASLGALEKGKQVHADIIKAGIASYINLENTLVDMYIKCGSVKHAREVFDNMAKRDVVSWSAMMAGCAQHRSGMEALKIYEEMQQEGVTPDSVMFLCILNVCASLGALVKGIEVHADIIKSGIASCTKLENTLIDMYAKCGSVRDARQVFDNMAERDVVSWGAMITACAQNGCGKEALQLFEQMQQEGLTPTGITFISVLSACSHVGLVDEGSHYFESMIQDHGLKPAPEHFGCMVDLLGRAGRLDEAEDFINKMPMEPDGFCVGGLAWCLQNPWLCGVSRTCCKMHRQGGCIETAYVC